MAAATTRGVALSLPGGQQVGASESAVLAGTPGARVEMYGSSDVIHYDVAHGTPAGNIDEYWGATALTDGGPLVSFSSSVMYSYDC